MHALLHPCSETFMQLALAELVLLGIVGGVVECWIVHELAYSAQSLAHALFPGLVAAALLGLPLLLGGAAGVAGAAAAVALVRRVPLLGPDTAVATVITSLFGLGVLLALSPATPPGLDALVFGDLLGVTRADVAAAGILALAAGSALVALQRPLLGSSARPHSTWASISHLMLGSRAPPAEQPNPCLPKRTVSGSASPDAHACPDRLLHRVQDAGERMPAQAAHGGRGDGQTPTKTLARLTSPFDRTLSS